MSASVRISLKTARDALAALFDTTSARAFGELEAAIARATRASTTRRTLAKPKREKKATRNAETKAIRAEVMRRANGMCEACGQRFEARNPPTLDHFFGRAKAQQSIRNTWGLCFSCHRSKTDNDPSSEWWLRRFINHAEHHRYSAEAAKARKKLAWLEARGGGA